MLEKNRKQPAYMACQQHERGFTFITLLFTLSIIIIMSPFLGYLLRSVEYTSNYDETSVYQFFYFLRNEVIKSTDVTVHDEELILTQDPVIAKFNQYEDVVRRQVNGSGHEIYLRDVETITFQDSPFGVRVRVTNIQGDTYEKTIIHYP
ncbi:competence type IV pilus minor pilin ComGF [Oceanobacillus bengalensis]|uniref:Competence protein ComGF n=1 Tax=Oceanobacillus bengalensis TaxID=1435466 RepID=A0A494Z0W1_9BACI|nr:competence type IV pilus minor pilin ComGF [Oceanobacillus bengalensis]RKQ16018.1 hypothetical protein D8M05_07910 [Oceanobacillus bengalensis]